MNQEQEAIDILLAGNALEDLRALVRNAPREASLRAMLEFLESTHAYVQKVMAFVRALEPTIAAQRPELAGRGGHVDRPELPARCDCGWILPAAFQVMQPGNPSPMFPNQALLLFACGSCGVWLHCNLSMRGGAKTPNAAGMGGMGLVQVDGSSEPTIAANANAAKLGEIFSAPRPYLAGAFGDHERDTREAPANDLPDRWLLHCSCGREQTIVLEGWPGGVTLTEALGFGWIVNLRAPTKRHGIRREALCPFCRPSQKGAPNPGPSSNGRN